MAGAFIGSGNLGGVMKLREPRQDSKTTVEAAMERQRSAREFNRESRRRDGRASNTMAALLCLLVAAGTNRATGRQAGTSTGTGGFSRLQSGQTATVQVIRIPTNSLLPDVIADNQGTQHMVYGQDHHAYYVRSTNNGATFTSPVQVNSSAMVETKWSRSQIR